ncbi:ATP-binding protein [Labilibaculum sp.]|uniref:ATP-binding protein n=1 Tax=Labilibaculum sp. TaxID=2060723 RepID=UPI00356B3B5C
MENNKKVIFSNKEITKPFFISLFILVLIFFSTYTYTSIKSIHEITKNQTKQIENLIITEKKDYIKSAVERTISDLLHDEKILLKELSKNQKKAVITDSLFIETLKNRAADRIRNTSLQDTGYLWVNEIINYQGGDKYAIRKIHSNLPQSEGLLLSTNLTDIKGNTPYLTELNGIKQNGEIYFKYWFKKKGSSKISQKLSYAKLYKKFNWIIASGVYLDDVNALINAQIQQEKTIIRKQTIFACIMIFISLVLAFVTILIFKAKIRNTTKFYLNQVKEREDTLSKFNANLENMVLKRTQQLNESELRYKSLFKNNQSIMLLIEPNTGNIVDANDAALNFYGYSFDELTSMNINQVNTLPNTQIKDVMAKIVYNQKSHLTFKHKLANNEIRDVEVYSEKMMVHGEELLYSIVHDITDLTKTQEALLVAKKKAEESDKLKSAFLANMSHEIRTPMNAILGFSGLLANPDNTPSKNNRFIDIITNSGKQLMCIINDIIDISKIESNQLSISIATISVNETLKNIFEVLQKTTLEKGKQSIEVRLNLLDDKKYYQIETDEVRFIQIYNNLLSNAVKFTPSGSIEIGFQEIQENSQSYLEFYVKDTGYGIHEDKFEHIFERFSQISETNYREGNGLGLSITKGLVLLLGGTIRLESKLDIGTTFYFTIPWKKTLQSQNTPKKEKSPKKEYDFSGVKIIIAEDDISSFAFLEEILLETNALIYHANNGLELINSLSQLQPDLVLLDINMPIMNGYQAISEIRKTNKNLKVIAQTAYAMPEEKKKILKAGCTDYLSKPIHQQELYKILSKHLHAE